MPTTPQPLLIASAPNGAYKTQHDHSELPITAAQLADTAVRVSQAGARMLHLHVRDEHGKHTLNANSYQAAINAIRESVGNELFIQVTSEAAGIYTAAQQRQAIYEIIALADDSTAQQAVGDLDGVSISLSEFIREKSDLVPTKELLQYLAERKKIAQYIFYSCEDIVQYDSLLQQEIVPPENHSALLVVGRHRDQNSTPQVLHQMVEALQSSTNGQLNWMVCAFGEHEFACLTEAIQLGGHVRVGFENNLYLKSGELAADNVQLIRQLIEEGNPDGRPLVDREEADQVLSS